MRKIKNWPVIAAVARCLVLRLPRAALAAARLAPMRAAMAARLGEPGLDMATVAATVGLAERSGYAVFEAADLRFEETLYAMRLERAMAVLSAGGAPKLLALALGFTDLSHFNRRFRGRFGCTPGEARAAGRASAAEGDAAAGVTAARSRK